MTPLLPQVAHAWELYIRPHIRAVNASAVPLLVTMFGQGPSAELQKPIMHMLSPQTNNKVKPRWGTRGDSLWLAANMHLWHCCNS